MRTCPRPILERNDDPEGPRHKRPLESRWKYVPHKTYFFFLCQMPSFLYGTRVMIKRSWYETLRNSAGTSTKCCRYDGGKGIVSFLCLKDGGRMKPNGILLGHTSRLPLGRDQSEYWLLISLCVPPQLEASEKVDSSLPSTCMWRVQRSYRGL